MQLPEGDAVLNEDKIGMSWPDHSLVIIRIQMLFFMQWDVFDSALCVRNGSRVGMLLMA